MLHMQAHMRHVRPHCLHGTDLLLAETGLRVEVEHDVHEGPDDVRKKSGARHLADQGRHHLRNVVGYSRARQKCKTKNSKSDGDIVSLFAVFNGNFYTTQNRATAVVDVLAVVRR